MIAGGAGSDAGSAAASGTGSLAGHTFSLPRVNLRIEYISDFHTRTILASHRLASVLAWALLIWELVLQTGGDDDSLMRTHMLEWVNIGVGSACLAPLLLVNGWFGRRLWHTTRLARRGAARVGRRQRYLLQLTAAELALHTLNLCLYLSVNIYSVKVACGWFDTALDALTLLSLSVWNTLFCLNVSRPIILLPQGAWQRLRLRWARGCWLQRCAAAACCCAGAKCCGGLSPHAEHAGGAGDMQHGKQGVADLEQQRHELGRSFSLAAEDEEDGVTTRRVHAAVWLALWLPTQALIVVSSLGGMGVFQGVTTVKICSGGHQNCVAPSPEQLANKAGCQQWDWDCSSSPEFTALAITIGGMFAATLALFVLLMVLVLAEYRQLPYTPFRVLNIAARLQLRTRMLTTLFFLVCVLLLFYLNIDSCNANLELGLGLGPMMISMTLLLATEAFLYSPGSAQQSTLRLRSALQEFAWTEADAPSMQARRGLPGEPLFCFETALKSCYFALHSYRHFRPESTVSSLRTAMKLYGCTHYEWLREPIKDVNCLLMWGPASLVITFRGTQSLANIQADAQFWRSPHPPKRGIFCLGMQPLVHTGFLDSWIKHGLDCQVMERARQVLAGAGHAAAMPPLSTTVVRCCSDKHERQGVELAAAAEAALRAEAQRAAAAGGGVAGHEADGAASAGDEEALAAVLAELMGQHGTAPPPLDSLGGDSRGYSAPSDGAARQGSTEQPFRILLSGHSLGGAVATLCAFDLARELPGWGCRVVAGPGTAGPTAAGPDVQQGAASAAAGVAGVQQGAADAARAGQQAGAAGCPQAADAAAARPVWLSVYSFGSPRTGNHAFAKEYGRLVPDSWSVINDQDLVAKSAKFVLLFKRPGNVAILNPQGDLIINPSFLEHNVHRTYKASVKQHLLVSYNQSFAAVLRAQHQGKAVSGGAQALAVLAVSPAVRELLVKPLSIRHASLRRYIEHTASISPNGSAKHGLPGGPAGRAAGTAGAAQQRKRQPELPLQADLSGDWVAGVGEPLKAVQEAEQAGGEEEEGLQPAVSAARAVLHDVMDTLRL